MSSREEQQRERESVAARIDTSVAHPARRYDYWLGGKDNFAADRASGDAVARAFPSIRTTAIENRRFLQRTVRFLADNAGIRQFLDIGSGLPTNPNVHEVAQAVTPAARVVYVDNDPIVLTHARALLTSSPEGATAYLDADLHDPEKILSDANMLETLDLSQPVGLTLVAVLHFIADDKDPYGIVRRLTDALAPGSYLVMSHGTVDYAEPQVIADIARGRYGLMRPRSREEFARFFDGLQVLPPGIVSVAEWGTDDEPGAHPSAAEIGIYGAVGRIP